jgi:hypothetical protein
MRVESNEQTVEIWNSIKLGNLKLLTYKTHKPGVGGGVGGEHGERKRERKIVRRKREAGEREVPETALNTY